MNNIHITNKTVTSYFFTVEKGNIKISAKSSLLVDESTYRILKGKKAFRWLIDEKMFDVQEINSETNIESGNLEIESILNLPVKDAINALKKVDNKEFLEKLKKRESRKMVKSEIGNQLDILENMNV